MSNVVDNDTHEQIRALRRLGWTLSRIQEATGIRRETVSGYLTAAGIAVRGRSRRSESKAKRPFSEGVSTDLEANRQLRATGCPPTLCVRYRQAEPRPRAPASRIARLSATHWRVSATPLPSGRTLVDDHGFPARYPRVAS